MKTISGRDARQVHLAVFGVCFIVWAFLGVIIGGYFGYQSGSSTVFWIIFISCLFGFNYLAASWQIRKSNRIFRRLCGSVINKLERADYYNCGLSGAIAIDSVSKDIATIDLNKDRNSVDPYVFNFNKVRSYRAFSPGYTTSSSTGTMDIVDKSRIHNENNRAASDSYDKSGIYMDLDDVKHPQVFVQMDYNEAEKWLLIFEKLADGSLEEQEEPMLFPPD